MKTERDLDVGQKPLGYEVFTMVLRCVALSRWHCVCPRRDGIVLDTEGTFC
jgi:hypothetical protein